MIGAPATLDDSLAPDRKANSHRGLTPQNNGNIRLSGIVTRDELESQGRVRILNRFAGYVKCEGFDCGYSANMLPDGTYRIMGYWENSPEANDGTLKEYGQPLSSLHSQQQNQPVVLYKQTRKTAAA